MNLRDAVALWILFGLAIFGIARVLVIYSLKERIRTGIGEEFQKRLAAQQLVLDKELEAHKAALTIAAERLRSELARSSSDFAIYAQRRHDAITELFAAFLRAELLIQDRTDLADPDDPSDMRENAYRRVIRARNDAYEAHYRNVLYLPDDIEAAATEVLHAFHKLAVEYSDDVGATHSSRGAARDTLRAKLAGLQRKAREELSSARPRQLGSPA
jgi:hypothetical protein